MEFIDLKTQFNRIEARIRARMDAVLAHGHFIMGPEVAELERELAGFSGAKHCISCASGTEALLMALLAAGIGPGDAVFVPPFSFFATAEAPALLGATPVMVDIDPISFGMSPSALDKAVLAVRKQNSTIYPLPASARERALKPRAVIPVDLFGLPADYDFLLPVAAANNLLVVEDAAQAFGAEYHGNKACALGCDMAVTSFFPAKPLGCYGDGGALFTEDDDVAETLRSIRIHGKGESKYDNVRLGVNGRMDTLQAAILLAKLEIFSEELTARRLIAGRYAECLTDIAGITLPSVPPGVKSAWAQYSILVADGRREAVATRLKERGIPTNIYYPTPMHMLAAFKQLGYAPQDMPNSLAASRRILALPFHPYMTEADTMAVADTVREAML